MKAIALFIISVLPFTAFTSYAQTRWGEDRLVGHFDEGLTQVAAGYSHFDCLYGTGGDLFVAFIAEGTSTDGDLLTIRKSFDDGLTWAYERQVTGGPNELFSPNACLLPGGDFLLLVTVSYYPGGNSFLDSYRYTYETLSYQGYSQADFSYPGSGNPYSCFSVTNEAGGEIWLFVVDDNQWLYLTRSPDGITWTPSVPVAANVERPFAEVSADGHVAVVWSHSTSSDLICTIADSEGNFQPAVTVTENASTNASAVAGWEHIGEQHLGVVWHNSAGQCFMNISPDGGGSWGPDLFLHNGIYPYIDHFEGTNRMGACMATASSEVVVTSSPSLAALPQSQFTVRSCHQASLGGPPKVVFGGTSGQLALFYLGPGTVDFWFNSSVLLGIEEEEESGQVSVTAGPNPANGHFSVISSGFPGMVHYRVYSTDGRCVYTASDESGGITVSAVDLPAGTYTIVAEDDFSAASCRVVCF